MQQELSIPKSEAFNIEFFGHVSSAKARPCPLLLRYAGELRELSREVLDISLTKSH